MEYYPSAYLSHSVVRRSRKLKGLINEADKVCRKLTHLKTLDHSQERFGRAGFLGLFGPKVDLLDHYEKKLEDIDYNVRLERSSKEVAAAFVSFKTRFGAAVALHIRQGMKPTEWTTEPSPDPDDVYWPFFSASFFKRWFCNVAVYAACAVLIVLFLIPVLIVQGLTHLEQLEIWFPFLKGVLRLDFVSEVVTGYLPSLILQMFLSLVPGWYYEKSRRNVYKIDLAKKWQKFTKNSSSCKDRTTDIDKATFFIAYVVTSGWTNTASELLQLNPLFLSFFKKRFCNASSEEFDVPSIPYHREIPRLLLFGLLGVTYFFLAPLILPFIVIFYCIGYVVYRHQLVNVYAPKFETGGQFWPIVHDSTIFSLILMHLIAIGIFGLKKLSLASSLTIPLPILTLIFNSYCRRRFLPIFMAYSAESLISKDRSDQNDPSTSAFYEELKTAYQDPSLMPIPYPRNNDRQTTPLLHTP
ncbi:unnamed protein product [Cuscuta campestris]|uniref:CSC1/OSCA1-like 7TM region domain-containing protein n=1 Tax=Cuscuta campestris TaxID=132261 RepID=A0A484MT20_9ASTE|nr:unnamed protein product [Cuscuta campestris]